MIAYLHGGTRAISLSWNDAVNYICDPADAITATIRSNADAAIDTANKVYKNAPYSGIGIVAFELERAE